MRPNFDDLVAAENRCARLRLLTAIRHRRRRYTGAKPCRNRVCTEAQKAKCYRKHGTMDDLHRMRVMVVITQFVPHIAIGGVGREKRELVYQISADLPRGCSPLRCGCSVSDERDIFAGTSCATRTRRRIGQHCPRSDEEHRDGGFVRGCDAKRHRRDGQGLRHGLP